MAVFNMTVTIDLQDLTTYVSGIRPRGFNQAYTKHDLATKPGSITAADLAPGQKLTLFGILYASSQANLRTLITNMELWLRPRREPYLIDYRGLKFYGKIVNFEADDSNYYDRSCKWECTIITDEPVGFGEGVYDALAQDTIVAIMNNFPGILMPAFYAPISTGTAIYEISDIDGAVAANGGSTMMMVNPPYVYSYGTLAAEYDQKLTQAPSCTKYQTGTGHSGAVGGVYWNTGAGTPYDLSAENCYTIWIAMLIDKSQISAAKVGLFDGTNVGYANIYDRIESEVWCWIPAFVRECEKDNGSLDTSNITRFYITITPNTNDDVTMYLDGQVLVRHPAKISISPDDAVVYDTRSGKAWDITTGEEVDPHLSLQGRPWLRPGANLIYQNSHSTSLGIISRSES